MALERNDSAAQRRSRTVRWLVLGAVLVFITGVTVAHQRVSGAGKPVGVDALCPFGGIETLFSLISGAGFVHRTAASAVVLLLGSIVLALVFRRSFCGQVCPLGALQGVFGALGRRVSGGSRREVPPGLDRVARLLKYAVLVFFAVWTWQAATLVIRPYDPWAAYAHLTSDEVLAEFSIGLIVLGVSLGGSFIYERFFCKYLCPTGAFLGLFSRLSVFGIARDPEACIDCRKCDTACPMNVEVSTAATVTASECISCSECVNICPVSGALEIVAPRPSAGASWRRVSPALMTGLVVILLAGAVGASTAAGAFDWRVPTLAEAIERTVEPTGAPFDTALIKGYMSMREIAAATGIAEARFTEVWGVPSADLGRPMKEIKDAYGFSPDAVRVWVAQEVSR